MLINEKICTEDIRLCIFQKALHVRALRTFTDSFKRKRLHGEEWLVYASDAETHIPDVYEEVKIDILI